MADVFILVVGQYFFISYLRYGFGEVRISDAKKWLQNSSPTSHYEEEEVRKKEKNTC